MNQKTILSWLTGCPASDINFKGALAEANRATCEAALQHVTAKGAVAAISARLKKLEKLSPPPGGAASEPQTPVVVAPGTLSKAPKGVRTVTLDTLNMMPAVPAPAHDEWANARQYAQMVEGGTQVMVVAQVMCGFELIELQKRHGLGRGGDRKSKPNASVLKWEDVVKKEIGRSDDTARNWMNMARAVAPKLKKLDGPWEAPALLALPPSEWPQGAREAVAKTLHGICDAGTQAGWMEELGLVKTLKRKGGAQTKGEGSEPQKPPGWTDAAWERYVKLPAEQREAVDLARPVIDAMHDAGDPDLTFIPHLPAPERRELEAAHRRIAEILAAVKR